MTLLPDKPSELIRVALKDLEACEQDDRYVIDMSAWHSPQGRLCHVCLAGAVMAQSLGVSPHYEKVPSEFQRQDPDTETKLLALNRFREGLVVAGLRMLCIEQAANFEHLDNPSLDDVNLPTLKEAMRELASTLEHDGL